MESNEAVKVWLAWILAEQVPGRDPRVWRQDDFGALIRRDEFGKRDSEHGFELDHVVPARFDGTDSSANLRALFWRNNLARNKPSEPYWSFTWWWGGNVPNNPSNGRATTHALELLPRVR